MTESILIVGAGVAGLSAAVQVADAGARAVVVERGPAAGGNLAAAMSRPGAIGDRAGGLEVPLFETVKHDENIELLTLAELTALEGRAGSFTATVRESARLVTDACTRCNLCRAACPVVLPNEFDAGLTYRKAIYTPMSETLPEAYVIDLGQCLNTPPNYLPCQRCVEVCDDNAIDFHLPLVSHHERQAAAVVLAPGFQFGAGAGFEALGYGGHPDILLSAELQRLLETPGPTGGYATRPSNEEYPDSVMLVLDALSPFALYIVASQVHQLLEQDVATVAVLVLSQPAPDAEQSAAAETLGLALRWGTQFRADPESRESLRVSYQDFTTNRLVREQYDLVVLCSDVGPPDQMDELASAAGVELADNGYLAVADGCTTSRPGVFVAGCASGPKNVSDSIASARAAATSALQQMNPRLLQADATAVQPDGKTGPALVQSEEELRTRIEQVLYGLLR